MEPTEVVVAKRPSRNTRATAAKRTDRTIGRTAKPSKRSKATPTKPARRQAPLQQASQRTLRATTGTLAKVIPEKAVPEKVTPATQPNQDSAATATQTTLRTTWKGQQQDAEAFAKIQHGAIVDQRAHVRATSGHRWTARKTH